MENAQTARRGTTTSLRPAGAGRKKETASSSRKNPVSETVGRQELSASHVWLGSEDGRFRSLTGHFWAMSEVRHCAVLAVGCLGECSPKSFHRNFIEFDRFQNIGARGLCKNVRRAYKVVLRVSQRSSDRNGASLAASPTPSLGWTGKLPVGSHACLNVECWFSTAGRLAKCD